MLDFITFLGVLSSITTILGGIGSAISFWRNNKQASNFRLQIVSFIVIIITGFTSAVIVLWPTIVSNIHENQYNQTIATIPDYTFSLQNADKNWETGRPYGSGYCGFQDKAYDIVMTNKDSYYPCFLQKMVFKDFMCQVEVQIKKGDGGGIIFRDDSHRSDAYYLYVAEDGKYALNYWPNSTGQGVITLFGGTNERFYNDQVGGRVSVVAVRAHGDDISAYIDGAYVGSVKDARIVGGRIALASQKTLNDTEIKYKQVQIWRL